jgi:hypothetical protein
MKKMFKLMLQKIADTLGWCCVELSVKLYHSDRFPKLADQLYKAGIWFYTITTLPELATHFEPDASDEWLYDWHIHFNPYSTTWFAYHEYDRSAYFNGDKPMYPIWSASTFCELLDKLRAMHSVDQSIAQDNE